MKHMLAILILCSALGFSQAQEKPIVQFSGLVYNLDSNVVVPYVSISNRSDRGKTFSANHQGYFSFVAHEGDTIVFSSIGYRREALVIPANVPDKKYTVIIKLKAEVVNLPMVRVLPWAFLSSKGNERTHGLPHEAASDLWGAVSMLFFRTGAGFGKALAACTWPTCGSSVGLALFLSRTR